MFESENNAIRIHIKRKKSIFIPIFPSLSVLIAISEKYKIQHMKINGKKYVPYELKLIFNMHFIEHKIVEIKMMNKYLFSDKICFHFEINNISKKTPIQLK